MSLPLLIALLLLGLGLALVLVGLLALRRDLQRLGAGGDEEVDLVQVIAAAHERSERSLRGEMAEAGRLARMESAQTFTQFQQALSHQLTAQATMQHQQMDGFVKELARLSEQNTNRADALRAALAEQQGRARDEQAAALQRFGDTLHQQLAYLTERNESSLAQVRQTLEQKLKDIEIHNAARLEEMRRTVDEKLHATLERRLGESFRLVSERLEQVQRGLGEMQTLAAGVGDLKRVLTNVKTRGTWGEVQLEALLEQLLTREQYEKNVATVPRSNDRVEFALRLPGQRDDAPVWLPIDAKFPREDYERLLDAQDRADPLGVEDAARALEARVRQEARTIAEKYLAPPHTTDFALLFLPTEGLYAEVLRRPGLSDAVQRDYRVTLTGPTTLTALLNSLQMGFRTLAIEKRSSEVWQVLGAVKTEFGKFGDVLARTRAQLETVTRSIDLAERRSRAMGRRLTQVEALPEGNAADKLGDPYLALRDEDR